MTMRKHAIMVAKLTSEIARYCRFVPAPSNCCGINYRPLRQIQKPAASAVLATTALRLDSNREPQSDSPCSVYRHSTSPDRTPPAPAAQILLLSKSCSTFIEGDVSSRNAPERSNTTHPACKTAAPDRGLTSCASPEHQYQHSR